ncbi:MAG: TatD family hydrolase [Candidatus Bipolaricaulia bacterium]
MKIFDAHIHSDCRGMEDFEQMALFGTEAAVTCAHDTSRFSSAASLLDHFQRLLNLEIWRLRESGLEPYVALGIHPLTLPFPGMNEALKELPAYLKRERVVALGEVGLQRGSEVELRVLREQLGIAERLDLPVILHTPRENKRAITKDLITAVEEAGASKERVLIDHVNSETIDLVKEFGGWIGLTVHPGKLAPRQAAELVRDYGAERAILSSDIASARSDIYAIPKAVLEMRKVGVDGETIGKAVYGNAHRFYRLEGKERISWN